MAKIKLTKTELKKQRDSLKQFQRFLPTLQLKKQQLQMEMRKCQELLDKNKREEEELKSSFSAWMGFFSQDGIVEHLSSMVSVAGIETDKKNIAGVDIPVFRSVNHEIADYDLFMEEPWIDDAIKVICRIIEIRAESKIIKEQYRLIAQELRVTTQRVNLFEKIKIPECRDNIRSIQIYIGDMDTAAVCRSKIAKRKTQEAAA